MFEYRRVENDVRDAAHLADLLRMGRVREACIAPPATRELREFVRHRAELVGLPSHCNHDKQRSYTQQLIIGQQQLFSSN